MPVIRIAWLILFAISFGFWLLLSGHYDVFHVSAGVICAALVAALTLGIERRAHFMAAAREAGPLFRSGAAWARFPWYLLWLLGQMVKAALAVAAVLVHPRLPITPIIVRLPCALDGDLPLTTYGNSITLTPGTVTVDVQEGAIVVHALTREAADELLGGAMEARVARTFGSRSR
jgi:multicomponent Na+:H+ antiporter subunit E